MTFARIILADHSAERERRYDRAAGFNLRESFDCEDSSKNGNLYAKTSPNPHVSRGPKPAARRSASVLVFVMAILGVLFVTGITFMSMMNFEAQMIDAERQRGGTAPRAEEFLDDVGQILGESLTTATEPIDVSKLIGSVGTEFATLPGVHNFFAPTEPYRQDKTPHDVVYPWFTDALAMLAKGQLGNVSEFKDLQPNTEWISGLDPDDPSLPNRRCGGKLTGNACTMDFECTSPDTCEAILMPVDADGDGIVDAMEVDIDHFGIHKSQYRALAKLLNPVTRPDGRVYLGLRVIAHGGMVNINDSAPTLLANILDVSALPFENNHRPPYSPLVEEAALRRRNFLPANALPATRIQGNPLESKDPASVGGDYAVRLFAPQEDLWKHRFWPFAPDEIDTTVDPARPIWSIRMDPKYASPHRKDDEYDRRHLVTTISHDDLLRRDTWVTRPSAAKSTFERVNVFELMAAANDQACASGDPLPFEYLTYPIEVSDAYRMKDPPVPPALFNWCECRAEPGCTLNPRKGRLQLSLPWLQQHLVAGTITKEQQIRLIQDAFTLLLLNARGPEWGNYESIDIDGDGVIDVPSDVDGDGTLDRVAQMWVPYDADPGSTATPIARTAAALTANLIDFADDDDLPTEVELRSADYTDPTKFGRPILGEYAYGLERQPFITEVVALADGKCSDGTDADHENPCPLPLTWNRFFGVELFNPYDETISLIDYELRISAAALTTPISLPFPIASLAGGRFVGFFGGDKTLIGSTAGRELEEIKGSLGEQLWFDETSKIQLVWYPPGTGFQIVVDEINLSEQPATLDMIGFWDSKLRSSQRIANPVTPWTAPVPVDFLDPDAIVDSSLIGTQRARDNTLNVRPVEVQFANTGSLNSAFPTTGSLLLLMRYANSDARPFTSYLTRFSDKVIAFNPTTGGIDFKTPAVDSRLQIDNGRMPVFDPAGLDHIDPGVYEPIIGVQPATTFDRPGDLEHLPWGQLVFDYFTTLPLYSDGPYAGGAADDHAPPRVDQDGLRVHGRININAAPWKVLEGLPFVPMEQIPGPFRDRFRDILYGGSPPKDDKAQPIGDKLAKAIVACRELRSIDEPGITNATGQYGGGSAAPDPKGRSWNLDAPASRRGSGFMTVGELANVRHGDASGAYRMDAGVVGTGFEDYLDAIAVLASLGDWVTVRSQVFTIYGSLRGEPEEDPGPMSMKEDVLKKQKKLIDGVNSRALRFQETIDRLPTFLGSGKPARVGDRSISAYHEVLHD